MEPSLALGLPDLETLTAGLSSVLCGHGGGDGRVIVLERQPNTYARGSRSEIVTCRVGSGTELRVFCKYEDKGNDSHSDVAYEAEIYRHVLEPSRLSPFRFHGAYAEETTGRAWLILEYLDDSVSLDETWEPAAMARAAAWLGRFHAATEALLSNEPMRFLKVCDAEYYLERARWAVRFAGDAQGGFPWLPLLCQRLGGFVAPLLAARPTVTHGDYYPHNVLSRGGTIYPIDWENAAIDVGEMDLACLTDGAPAEIERECEREYRLARWPEAPPADFEETLAAARLCLFVYNLGQPDWTRDSQCLWYSRRLRSLAERLGLI